MEDLGSLIRKTQLEAVQEGRAKPENIAVPANMPEPKPERFKNISESIGFIADDLGKLAQVVELRNFDGLNKYLDIDLINASFEQFQLLREKSKPTPEQVECAITGIEHIFESEIFDTEKEDKSKLARLEGVLCTLAAALLSLRHQLVQSGDDEFIKLVFKVGKVQTEVATLHETIVRELKELKRAA